MAEKAGNVAQAPRGKGGGKGGGKGVTKGITKAGNDQKIFAMWKVAFAKAQASHDAYSKAVAFAKAQASQVGFSKESQDAFAEAFSEAEKLEKLSGLDCKRAKAIEVSWKTD
jgi:hypothetical protein